MIGYFGWYRDTYPSITIIKTHLRCLQISEAHYFKGARTNWLLFIMLKKELWNVYYINGELWNKRYVAAKCMIWRHLFDFVETYFTCGNYLLTGSSLHSLTNTSLWWIIFSIVIFLWCFLYELQSLRFVGLPKPYWSLQGMG